MSLRTVREIDWENWRPRDVGTLLFIVRDGEVLLIRKKRGLGAGKINGPGGRLEPGESPLAAAIREVEEEVCVTPSEIEARGELSFDFTDGYRLHAHVFVAFAHAGTPSATPEADPFWCSLEELPYASMWADDALWLPHVLAGRGVRGRFVFEGDEMLDYELDVFEISSPARP
ncbi:MAG TPA: 8-oxo-dGTP diphosphatase [Polyangiaceae bacterium]|nr:8-oxo-dGTP diphosphatase [Polyangiaceae bacterium]